jgi:Mrp family chromosome partitioning ATPase
LRAVSGRPNDPEGAAIASRLADFRALVGDKDPTLDIVSAASPPLSPAWPKPVLGVVVAAMIGLLLGIALVVGLEMSSPVIRRLDSLLERGGPPVLTRMPQLSADETRAALLDPSDVPEEVRASVRTLWANLGSLPAAQSKAGMLLVTSAGDRADSAAPAALLATLMARAGMRIMLIDADLERGPLAAIFDGDVASVASLGHLLERGGNGSTAPSAQPAVVPSQLRVLLDDPEDRHLTKWMPPERITALVERLKDEVDAVVVSGPPPPTAETTVLAELADAVVITVSLGRTRREQLAAIRTALENRGVVPSGYVVLERRSLLTRVIRRPEKPSSSSRWT